MRAALEEILKDREASGGLPIQMIVDKLILSYPDIVNDMERDRILAKANAILLKESKDKKGIFAKAKNPKTGKDKKGVYRYVKRTKGQDPLPKPIEMATPAVEPEPEFKEDASTNYVGKGGEFAVMAELLFRGYNANIMSVDEGIDIVATRKNVFYYLQVKTTSLQSNLSAKVEIKKTSFDRGLSSQLRYFMVVRCGSGETRYFKFSEEDITRYSAQGYILMNAERIIIKVRFGRDDHKPYLYHENKSIDIAYHQDNFAL